MLSILIPTYNFDCSKLCQNLHEQATIIGEEFEILVYDDFSSKKYQENRDLALLDNVTYKELARNYGRAAIRNLMANDAKGEYLLFLDCDGAIASSQYLHLYHKFKDEADVICGGRIYHEKEKIKKNYYLHWLYGVKKESKCNRSDAKTFMTNNFLIKKEVFNTIQFDQTMLGYGHEDTAFGIELKKKGFTLKVICNPIIHIDLYEATDFINNSRNAIRNLVDIVLNTEDIKDLEDVKIIRTYYCLKKYKLNGLVIFFYKRFKKLIEKNLKGKHPSLFLFDFYKLGYFSLIKKEGKKKLMESEDFCF